MPPAEASDCASKEELSPVRRLPGSSDAPSVVNVIPEEPALVDVSQWSGLMMEKGEERGCCFGKRRGHIGWWPLGSALSGLHDRQAHMKAHMR